MTYLAPRQGRFALIVLISFCLHIVLFVVSAQQQALKKETQAAQAAAKQLTQELKAPLSANDRVSVAVIVSRYVTADAIAYIGVYDTQGELIVPVGDDSKLEGDEVMITDGAAVLGRAVIKTMPVHRARIIAEHWLFVLGALVLHAMLWMIYGYVARPSKRLLTKIQDDTRERLLNQGVWQAGASPKKEQADRAATTPIQSPATPKISTQTNAPTQNSVSRFGFDKPKTIKSFLEANLPSNENAKTMAVQVAFFDKKNLFDVLDPKKADDYLALCDELFDKTIKTVLNTSQCQGVVLGEVTPFASTGAVAVLHKQQQTANLALAAVLIAKLFVLVNQVVYDKLRQSAHFALQIKTIATCESKKQMSKQTLSRQEEAVLLLLSKKDKDDLSDKMTLEAVKSDKGGTQTECYCIAQINEPLTQLLTQLRFQVLS